MKTTITTNSSASHDARVQEIFKSHFDANAITADKMFAWLFVFQWALGVAFAMFFSPLTWAGDQSKIHIHVFAALILGALLTLYPCYLVITRPGATVNRMVIACVQILFSILFIHVTGGRIETHFHVFGSLAFLAFYRDWRVIAIATVITAVDHLARGLYFPESVYGILVASPWRALEHALWVVFEDVILLYSIQVSRREMLSIADGQVRLEQTIATIEDRVQERTAELRLSQQTVLEQQQTLIANSKMSALGEMAGGVAHEINTPLATIKLLSGSLKDTVKEGGFDPQLGLELLTVIEDTTDRIAKIVKGLRSFSRNASQDPFEQINVRNMLEETLALCRERITAQGVRLAIDDIDPDLVFEGRPAEISQVVLNLISNAFDAIENASEDQRWIKVAANVIEDFIEIRVIDGGPGIPAELRQKIFQPFFTTKEVGKGTGLGLSIILGIVKSHNGDLFPCAHHQTTCFKVHLPRRQELQRPKPLAG